MSFPTRPFELARPNLDDERAGNTGTPGVWHFDSGLPGRQVLLTALIHGNELCGAWALKILLASGLMPRRGGLTLAFCNLAAFDRFDPADYARSRFVDEDMNRVWSADKLAAGDSQERRRAGELLPWVERADWLLDFHSMSNANEPLQLSGLAARNVTLARALGNPAYIVSDAGHAAGVRLRDYGRFAADGDPQTRSLLIECGFHGDTTSAAVALDIMARFLLASEIVSATDVPAKWLRPAANVPQALCVTDAVTARSNDFRFAHPWKGMEKLPQAGTVIGWSDGEPVTTPYDNCVLIMPSLANLRPGVTVLRLARPLA
ncbi:succinylglutamate desuccinylase/aspartoacylase domain-containing protein [Bordetella holmesii]|uniref:Succinylglutamate desuccinylase/aspartoacylase domain protein n=2 Tax=Bordetella holmesii TaxID=35814 RepID=A0A158M590_9BORD|nr:succinylglutamate desuccinylase/aspartoacylase family protein [Bordetella holmesii]AHV91516.1 succinylglutamate desuccinylase / Aspartoacylase family protein [Bordetella holmesii ATCC 51541]AIT26430.1 succinylglutamate desuccinylase / Aspartoacylase family protein [Bordetella holmesii 44057]EWM43723.1 succinylglutamate desuccinylase / Aspartoacylase family protein [Bordetella holmesii 41130]EWM47002.1 succinylglutamate desuccinylase / Aspartoacylase family protein [Bordetella holmesii 35009]